MTDAFILLRNRRYCALEWAKDLKPKYEQFQELQSDVSNDQQKLKEANETIQNQIKVLEKQSEQQIKLQAQKPKQEQRLSQKSVLENQRPIFKQASELRDQLKQAKTVVEKTNHKLEIKQKRLADLTKQNDQINEKLTQVFGLTKQLNELNQTAKTLETVSKQLAKLDLDQQNNYELKVSIRQNQNELSELKKQVDHAQTAYNALRNNWLRNQIANLVKQLEPGGPCPVCGSTDHPCPAHIADLPSVSDDDIKTAEAHLQQLQNKQAADRTKIDEQVKQFDKKDQQINSTLKELIAELISAHIFQKAPNSLAAVIQQVADDKEKNLREQQVIQKQQDDLKAEQEKQAHIKQDLGQLVPQVDQLKANYQEAQSTQQKYDVQLDDIAHRLPSEFSDLASLDQHLGKLQQAIDDYDQKLEINRNQLEDTRRTLAASQATETSLKKQINHAKEKTNTIQNDITAAVLKRLGTKSWDTLEKLVQNVSQVADLQQKIDNYQDKLQKIAASISAYEKIVGNHQLVDLTEAHAQLDHFIQVKNQLQDEYDKKHQQTFINDELLKQVQQNNRDIHNQQDTINQLQLLVETVNGSGDAKLGLERYVLQAQLKEILKVANQHLRQLSSGRYTMHLHQEAGAYQKNTGLEIDVYDDNVGQLRSVHTLSGGESFTAALSLALALGEVIQNKSGGINIDTLFVDEGFGLLDQESLSMAMTALENIESNNRMIGIISHVTMLQEQIPYQIRVENSGQGKSRTNILSP